MKDINEITKELFEKDSLQDVEINDVLQLDRRSLYEFALEIFKSWAEYGQENTEVYEDFFKTLNKTLDGFIMENSEEVDYYYNVISLNLVSVFAHYFYGVKYQNEKYDGLLRNRSVRAVIKILDEHGPLTQSELARRLDISPTALSNQLNRIKELNVVRKFKLPANQKQTYYVLTADCKRYYDSVPHEEIPVAVKRISRIRHDTIYWGAAANNRGEYTGISEKATADYAAATGFKFNRKVNLFTMARGKANSGLKKRTTRAFSY